MTDIRYIQSTERQVGDAHATLDDTLNRALRDVLTASGLDPDADFGGFGTQSGLGVFNVKSPIYGAVGDGVANDTTAVQAAITAALVAGGIVVVPPGTYLVDSLSITGTGGIAITGARGKSILKLKSGGTYVLSVNPNTGGTSDPTANTADILIQGLTLSGRVVESAFSQFLHILNLNACSRVTVRDCDILGAQGDGIYIGSSNVAGTERHNQDLLIENCLIDGLNNDNRNGITVIDCVGLTVRDCIFSRHAKSTMPGGIDIEPDAYAFHRVQNVLIERCRFDTINGNLGAVSVFLSSASTFFTLPIQNIVIRDCHATTIPNGALVYAVGGDDASESSVPINLVVQNCVGRSVKWGQQVFGLRGVVFEDVLVDGATYNGAIVGATTATALNLYEAKFVRCHYRNCASDNTNGGIGISVKDVEDVTWEDCRFESSGKTNGSQGYHFYFGAASTSSRVRLLRPIFSDPGSKVVSASVAIDAGHTLTPATNEIIDPRILSGSATMNLTAGLRTPPKTNASNGDADVTLTWGADAQVQAFSTTLTALRTITLASPTGLVEGASFLIRRTAAGDFALSVGGLINLFPSQQCQVFYNGSAWVVQSYGPLTVLGQNPSYSADNGDTSPTFTPGLSAPTQRFTTTLTANRTVTLSSTNAVSGSWFFVERAADGEFALTVGGLIVLRKREWCRVEYTGAAYRVVASGSLEVGHQVVDQWYQDNVTASQTQVEINRVGATAPLGRWIAGRQGSLTGIVVKSTEARTAGTLTIEVFKNTGLSGAAGSILGSLSAVLDGTNTSTKASNQSRGTATFNAGDELYAVITTTGAWTPTTADIRVSLEITPE